MNYDDQMDSRHFIDNEFVYGGEPHPNHCPYWGEIGKVYYAPDEVLRKALVSSSRAFPTWRKTSRVKRADLFFNLTRLLERDITRLSEVISCETGKSLNEARAEVVESIHMCQWVAAQGRESCGDWKASEIAAKDAYVIRKPKGVVAVISPWNFPLAIGSFWTTGPALLEGNTVVHKPSELTPFIASCVADLYREAGFPPGVYNVVHGDGNVGYKLVHAEEVRTILFTGSAAVGQLIRRVCAERFDRNCSIETGSKSAVILFEDGNQDLALDVMIASAFKLSGQRCVSSGRLLIQKSIYRDFCDRFVEEVNKKVTVGGPFDSPAPYCGPLISERHRERVEHFNELAGVGVNVRLRGTRPDRNGYFLTPHVYETEWDYSGSRRKFLAEEVFGPHVALVPFEDEDEAVRIYNDTEYGLALGVVTENFRTMRTMREECNAGMIYMNGGSVAAESHFLFGGVGKSGNGYKTAAGTYRAVTDEVTVTVNYEKGITWAQGMK